MHLPGPVAVGDAGEARDRPARQQVADDAQAALVQSEHLVRRQDQDAVLGAHEHVAAHVAEEAVDPREVADRDPRRRCGQRQCDLPDTHAEWQAEWHAEWHAEWQAWWQAEWHALWQAE